MELNECYLKLEVTLKIEAYTCRIVSETRGIKQGPLKGRDSCILPLHFSNLF